MAVPLISTKIKKSTRRKNLVLRERLYQRLSAGLGGKLIVIQAPAGYGKSTLVNDWLDQTNLDFAWYTLDASDNRFESFIQYLLQCLSNAGVSGLSYLKSFSASQSEVLETELVHHLERFNKPFLLVLDDYHLIQNESIHQFLQALLDHLPENTLFILIGRTKPKLMLGQLRARGLLTELNQSDLRFDLPETTNFLSHTLGLSIPEALISQIYQKTEGWAASIQLAGLRLMNGGNKKLVLDGQSHFLFDYLVESVFMDLPAYIQSFLKTTAVLDRFCYSLCDALVEDKNSREIINTLEDQNLFLIGLDADSGWYRYHHLFSEFLTHLVKKSDPHLFTQTARKAAAWFENNQLIAEAVQYALRSQDEYFYADLLERNAMQAGMNGQVNLVLGWIDAVSWEILQKKPRLCLIAAWMYFLQNRINLIPRHLEIAAAHYTAKNQATLYGEVAALQALLLIFQRQSRSSIDFASRTLSHIPESSAFARGVLHMSLGSANHKLGCLKDAQQHFEMAIPYHWEAGNIIGATFATLDLLMIAQGMGELKHAYQFSTNNLYQVQRQYTGTPAIGTIYIALGFTLLEWDHLQEAEEVLIKGVHISEEAGYFSAVYGKILLVSTKTAQGNLEEARRMILAIQQQLDLVPQPVLRDAAPWLVNAWLQIGDPDHAGYWAAILPEPDPSALQYDQIWGVLSRIRYTLSTNHAHNPAQHGLLSHIIHQARQHEWFGYLIESLILQARLHILLGDAAAAQDDLIEAIQLAEPQGYLRIFRNEISWIHPTLNRLSQRYPGSKTLQTLLQNGPFHSAQPVQPNLNHTLVEPLSEREIQVLQWMTDGLTYQGIAEKMWISVNTVRFHIKAIYGKLHAEKRSEAIQSAKDIGVI